MAVIERNGKKYSEVKAKAMEAYLQSGKYFLAKADLTKKQKSLEADLELGNIINDYEIEL